MEKLQELFFILIIVGMAGPIFVVCFLLAVASMGFYVLPTFFDPEFYKDLFEYISTIDPGEMFELLKAYILAHMEMY